MTSKEALDRLKFIADKELNTGSKSYKDLQEFWNYEEPLKVINNLVERDTPKKANNPDDDYFHCSVCNSWVDYDNRDKYCSECGQHLDWE